MRTGTGRGVGAMSGSYVTDPRCMRRRSISKSHSSPETGTDSILSSRAFPDESDGRVSAPEPRDVRGQLRDVSQGPSRPPHDLSSSLDVPGEKIKITLSFASPEKEIFFLCL
jgi:hypothetical protein